MKLSTPLSSLRICEAFADVIKVRNKLITPVELLMVKGITT